MAWLRYRTAAQVTGVKARLWPWLAVAFVALVGGVMTSRGGTDLELSWLNEAGPFVVNALALACLAWLLRSRVLALTAGVMVAFSAVVAVLLSGDVAVSVQLAAYAGLLLVASVKMAS
jgi:hypothetical protein